jgi:hypothetical protein
MRVVGADGEEVGAVKAVRPTDFLLTRRLARDVYVPLTAVRAVAAGVVTLTLPAGRVDDQGWPSPPLTGGEQPPSAASIATEDHDARVPGMTVTPTGYRCTFCGAEFASVEALAAHNRAAHLA